MILLSNYDHQKTFALVRIFIILGITWVFGIIGIMGTSEDMLPLSFDDDDKDNIGEMGTRVSLYHLIDNNDQWSSINLNMINGDDQHWNHDTIEYETDNGNMGLDTNTKKAIVMCYVVTDSLQVFFIFLVILLTNMFITIIPPWTHLSLIFCRASFYFGSSLSTGHHLNSINHNHHGTVN